MKKKFLCTLLAGMMVLSLTACGSKENENENTTTPTPTEAPANPTETPDEPTEAPTEAPAQEVDFSVNEMLNGIFESAQGNMPMLMAAGETELKDLYAIDPAVVEEYGVYIPMMMVQATEFAVFKAAGEENVQAVLDGINKRLDYLLESWGNYLPDQLELVQNHKLLVQGEYIMFIVAPEDIAAYAENVFLRKFDPSLEEIKLLRKFDQVVATLTELTENSLKLELVEGEKTYKFDCTFDEYIYIEGDIAEFAVGDTVTVAFLEPIVESDETMQGVVTYLQEYVEY